MPDVLGAEVPVPDYRAMAFQEIPQKILPHLQRRTEREGMRQPTTREYNPNESSDRFYDVDNAIHMTLGEAKYRIRELGEHNHKIHHSGKQYVIAYFDRRHGFLGYILKGYIFNA